MDKNSNNWKRITAFVDKWVENSPIYDDEFEDLLKFDTGLYSGRLEESSWGDEFWGAYESVSESEIVDYERIVVDINPRFILGRITDVNGELTEDLADFFSSKDLVSEDDVIDFCNKWIRDFMNEKDDSTVCSFSYKTLLEEEMSELRSDLEMIGDDVIDEDHVDTVTDYFDEDLLADRLKTNRSVS